MMCLILLAMTAYFPSLAESCWIGDLCCESDVTAGAYSYTKVQYTSAFPRPNGTPFMVYYPEYGCCWNCTFEMVGYPGSRYCFKNGSLVTVPGLLPQDKCFEQDKFYQGDRLGPDLLGEEIYLDASGNITGYPTNAFECGQACSVRTRCNYWTFSNFVGMGGPTITNIKPAYVFYQLPQFWTFCYLFKSGTTYDRKDAVSGVKGCPP
eukprot:GFUD01021217.1.p1 GENE.GFUD01021217.1~~GFUD01021217.1.p1  ORF type:complete len:227 (-),score=15.47 GFUD01021217.1:379-999(-)